MIGFFSPTASCTLLQKTNRQLYKTVIVFRLLLVKLTFVSYLSFKTVIFQPPVDVHSFRNNASERSWYGFLKRCQTWQECCSSLQGNLNRRFPEFQHVAREIKILFTTENNGIISPTDQTFCCCYHDCYHGLVFQSTIRANQWLPVNLLFWFRLFWLKNLVPFS